MRLTLIALTLGVLTACGGAEPAPKTPPKEEAPKAVEPAKTEEPAKPAEPVAAKPADVDLTKLTPDEQKAKLLEIGKNVYETGGSGNLACQTCHQANGEGLPPSFPPLKGQKEFMGDCAKHAGYVIKGLSGEITVNGQKYNGVMPAQAGLSDLEIAAVISYERMSWGNDFGLCMPDAVAAARKTP